MSNCPNCNAILSYEGDLHCDYCGAWFERPDEKAVDEDVINFYDWAGNIVYTQHVYGPNEAR